MRHVLLALLIATLWMLPGTSGEASGEASGGEVIITEIMYNPDSPEGRFPDKDIPGDTGEPVRTEWVEVYNTGPEPIDITGWYLADEDGRTTPLPESTFIQPAQAIVLIPDQCPVEEFRKAWGEGFPIFQLGQWGKGGLANLANSPSDTNEILTLRDADEEVVDEVNYDDEGVWPTDSPDGPSIYLIATALDLLSNDAGANWKASKAGVDGAREVKPTETFTGNDVGSPGVVEINPLTPQNESE